MNKLNINTFKKQLIELEVAWHVVMHFWMSKLAVLGVSNSGCHLKKKKTNIKENVKSDK